MWCVQTSHFCCHTGAEKEKARIAFITQMRHIHYRGAREENRQTQRSYRAQPPPLRTADWSAGPLPSGYMDFETQAPSCRTFSSLACSPINVIVFFIEVRFT